MNAISTEEITRIIRDIHSKLDQYAIQIREQIISYNRNFAFANRVVQIICILIGILVPAGMYFATYLLFRTHWVSAIFCAVSAFIMAFGLFIRFTRKKSYRLKFTPSEPEIDCIVHSEEDIEDSVRNSVPVDRFSLQIDVPDDPHLNSQDGAGKLYLGEFLITYSLTHGVRTVFLDDIQLAYSDDQKVHYAQRNGKTSLIQLPEGYWDLPLQKKIETFLNR